MIESSANNGFILKSPSLNSGELVPDHFIFNGQGCKGDNFSPALEWEGAPEETQSYAITVMDPDAPHAGGWRHWTVVNIPKDVTSIKEGASTKGLLPKNSIEIENDFHLTKYGGPCPPRGDRPHRYVFTIYALKSELHNIDSESDRTTLETSLQNNMIAKTSFTVKYGH